MSHIRTEFLTRAGCSAVLLLATARAEAAAPVSSLPQSNLPSVVASSQPNLDASPDEAMKPSGFAKEFPRYHDRNDEAPARSKPSSVRSRFLAAMLDVGLPDGAVLGVAFRPAFWTRIQAGAGTNSISPGMRAGAVLVPFSEGPSVTVEGGYYFEGDANSIVKQFAGPAYSSSTTAQRVGYQFVNFHLGLDFGSRYTTFFLHGGMTYLHTTLHHANDLLGGQTVNSQGQVTSYTFSQDVNLSVWFPSLKLGLLIYFV